MSKLHKNIRHIVIWIFVTTASLISFSSIEAAAPKNPPAPANLFGLSEPIIIQANIKEENGLHSFTLSPKLLDIKESGFGYYEISYEVGIPKEYLSDKSAIGAGATSEGFSDCDSKVSVCATLTLSYVTIFNHGWYKSVEGTWTNSDDAVIWSNAKLDATCYAAWYARSGLCNQTETSKIGSPVDGKTYSLTPTFGTWENKIVFNSISGIQANQSIVLEYQGATWLFSFCLSRGADLIFAGCV